LVDLNWLSSFFTTKSPLKIFVSKLIIIVFHIKIDLHLFYLIIFVVYLSLCVIIFIFWRNIQLFIISRFPMMLDFLFLLFVVYFLTKLFSLTQFLKHLLCAIFLIMLHSVMLIFSIKFMFYFRVVKPHISILVFEAKIWYAQLWKFCLSSFLS
jgi:hypothetical protein